jgi:hypothetical protein
MPIADSQVHRSDLHRAARSGTFPSPTDEISTSIMHRIDEIARLCLKEDAASSIGRKIEKLLHSSSERLSVQGFSDQKGERWGKKQPKADVLAPITRIGTASICRAKGFVPIKPTSTAQHTTGCTLRL